MEIKSCAERVWSLVVAKNDNLFDAVIVIVSLVTVNVFQAVLFFVDVARVAVVGIVWRTRPG